MLCNVSQPGNLRERLFGETTTGCPSVGGGLLYIFTETDPNAIQGDVQWAKQAGLNVWVDGTDLVGDQNLLPGEDAALTQLGFSRA